MTSTLSDALHWIDEASLGDDDQDKDTLKTFLLQHYPDEDFSVYSTEHLVSRTYLSSILLDLSVSPGSEPLQHVRSLLSSLHGVDTASMAAADLAWLHCRDPQLQDVPTSDLVLLGQDNIFCDAVSSCNQDLLGNLDIRTASVEGDLLIPELSNIKVFDVDFPSILDSTVSLSGPQQMNGSYTFSHLTVGTGGFRGEVQYEHGARTQSLHSLCGKLLVSSQLQDQTFTGLRSFGQLSVTGSVATGGDSSVSTDGRDFNIANIYGTSFQLDAAQNEISLENIDISNSLNVTRSLTVEGHIDGVDFNFALDAVVSGSDVLVSAPDGATHTISGVAGPSGVAITGQKIFTAPLTVTEDISLRHDHEDGSYFPVVDSFTEAGLVFNGGEDHQTKIVMINGPSQVVAGTLNVVGDVTIDSGLANEGVFSDINEKYEFDSINAEHEIKTKFNFDGTVTINNLNSENVRGRSWTNFMTDILPEGGSESSTMTGTKTFSGHMSLSGSETSLNTLNDLELVTIHSSQASIHQDMVLTGHNDFSSETSCTIGSGHSFRTPTVLALQDSLIRPGVDLEWLYNHTVPIHSSASVAVSGSLNFSQGLGLSANTNVGSFTLSGDTNDVIEVPNDLILVDTTLLYGE